MNAPLDRTPRERGLVFTFDNVRAIRKDAKTQTRRIIRDEWWRCLDPEDPDDLKQAIAQCPYGQSGDILYVRETWKEVRPIRTRNTSSVFCLYRASDEVKIVDRRLLPDNYRLPTNYEQWRPARYMPKWAARLRLEITRVRIQCIQQITRADQRAEGYGYIWGGECKHLSFPSRWNEANGARGSWHSNPWVFALTFRRLTNV